MGVTVELGERRIGHDDGSRKGAFEGPSILEHMFERVTVRDTESSPEIPIISSKHPAGSWRLRRMHTELRPLATSLGRTAALIALSAVLILVLFPAIAAQAASTV